MNSGFVWGGLYAMPAAVSARFVLDGFAGYRPQQRAATATAFTDTHRTSPRVLCDLIALRHFNQHGYRPVLVSYGILSVALSFKK